MSSEYDRTIADCTEAIRLNPRDASAYARRGAAYRMKGDYDRTIVDCTEAIRLNPNEYSAFADRGVANRIKGDLRRAIADCTEAKRLMSLPGWEKNKDWELGKDWVEWDDVNKKRIWPLTLKEIITLIRHKKISATTTVWKEGMGNQWAKAGAMPELRAAIDAKSEHDWAIIDLTEVIRLNPKDNAAFKKRGDAYSSKGKGNYAKAIADFTEAIRLKPDDAWAFAHRGETYYLNDDYDRAIADLTEAIRLNPKYAWAFARRGQTYRIKDDYERAIADLTEAVRLDTAHSKFLKAAQEEARKKPSLSWPPGAYYCTRGTWHAMPETEDEFVQLVKNKSITLDTLMVGVPNSMKPILMFSTPEAKKWFDSVVNPPSGLWKAVKVAGLFAGFAAGSILKAAARAGDGPGLRTCLKCKEQVNWTATRCPFCQGDPREF